VTRHAASHCAAPCVASFNRACNAAAASAATVKAISTTPPCFTSSSVAPAACTSRRTTPSSAYGTLHASRAIRRNGSFSACNSACATASVYARTNPPAPSFTPPK
jgi:hypothetical protein